MGRPQSEGLPLECIRYRLTRLQRLLPMLPATVIMAAVQVLIWLDGGPVGPSLSAVVLPFVLLIAWRPFGVTLAQSAAVVHNLPRRTIPWADVQAIQVESIFGGRTVVIYEAGGRRTRLRAPITGFLNWDRAFEEKFHIIGRWWLDHRGPDWAPVPPPGAWWGGPPVPGGNSFAPPA
ncbi:hypothetical protein ACFU8Q_01035 [Streptomyces sp. NPDC057543]|uniref:hypothetical protein n=1 Tax=Streptomyces sp. NPDC057543 TaxID=3346163 RepID=UPI0036A0BF0F